jgi:membrane-associated phospholipid phosphatase
MWATTLFPNKHFLSLSYVALSAWSQVYVGNHYVSDVLSGAIVGTLIGKIISSKYSKDLGNPPTSINIQIRF